MSKQVLALFDFCETLTDFQTLDRFLPMAGEHNENFNPQKNALRRKEYEARKQAYPRYESLIDMPLEEAFRVAKEFVFTEVISNLNQVIIDRLFYHQEQNHKIIIVSGGLEIYIKEFAKIYNIKDIVAVTLETSQGKLTGNIDGIHTMHERKLYKLKKYLNLDEYDLKNSYAYSDCVSDIPLLSLVGNANVIECGKDTQWAEILGFHIIKKDPK